MAISIIKRFKTFRFVRLITLGLGIANLIFSIFIIISFSDIDFSKFEIPTLSVIISILIGLFPFFFTDSCFYIYQGLKASVGTLLSGIIGNIVTTPEYNFEAKYLNGVTEQEYDEYFKDTENSTENSTENNKSNKTKYLLILAGVTLLGLGVVYYYHPEYYTLMYEYVLNIFNRRGGDPDPGTDKIVDNNLTNERLRGKAAHDIISRTVNKVNENSSKTFTYLMDIEEGFGKNKSDNFLKNIEELIKKNDKIMANFNKLPQPALSDFDIERYNDLLKYNNELKEFLEKKDNTINFPSTSSAGVKPESIDSVPSSPENVPQNLSSSQETIKPKPSQTILDEYFKPKKDNTTIFPSLEDTRNNVENSPPIPEPEKKILDSSSSINSGENKSKIKKIWKRFKSQNPPVGETTINPDYIPYPPKTELE